MSTDSDGRGGTRGGGTAPRGDLAADADIGRSLTEAMARLRPHEPAMPDLVGPAMVRGTRIRRRRRVNVLAAACAAVAVAVGSATYVGGGNGPVTPAAPTTRADDGAEALRQALAAELRPHLREFGIGLGEKPWHVTRNEQGSTVIITVENGDGDVTALTLSTGTAVASPPADAAGPGCSVPGALDRSGGGEYGGPDGICEVWPHGGAGDVTWLVRVNATGARAERVGAVRIGADGVVCRAWAGAHPAGVSDPGGLVLEQEMLAAIVSDPAVTAAVDRLPVSVTGEPPGPAAAPGPVGVTADPVQASAPAMAGVSPSGGNRPAPDSPRSPG